MLTHDMSPDQKLAMGMRLYSDARGHWMDSKERMDAAFAFAHGNQWHAADLKLLKEEGRPALTFNLVQQKVQQAVGMNEDNRRQVTANAVGANDRALADALNALLRHFYLDAHMDEVDSEAYEHGIIAGEGAIHVSFERDTAMPLWAKLKASVVNPKEVYWDPASRSRDRSDARYVIWPRWVSKAEFLAEYPQHEQRVNELFDEHNNASEHRFDVDRSEYYDPEMDSIIDVRRGRLCILHIEYMCPREKYFLTDGQGVREIDEEQAQAMQAGLGARPVEGTEVLATWNEQVYWLEMIQSIALFDGPSPEPYDGYSLVPWTCYLDPRNGYTAGVVRALMDPQRDVNKAYSQSLDHLAAQGKPGWIAEKRAVPDVNEFIRRNRQAGSVALVEDEAITGGQIRERNVAQYSPAVAQRLTASMEMIDRVSGIATDPESPARAVEAATTQLLREKKAIRSMRGVLYRFQRAQREVGRRVLEGIARAVPDAQVVAILSDAQRYRMMPGDPRAAAMGMPAGPHLMDMQLKQPVDLRNLRAMKMDIDLDPASESDMQRSMQLEVLVQLSAMGKVPVDPEVMLELAASSRSMKERLVAYFKQMQQMNQQMVQQEQMVGMQSTMMQAQAAMGLANAEATKARAEAGNVALEAQRKRAEDTADTYLAAQEMKRKQSLDAANAFLKVLEIWERADTSEKQLLLDMYKARQSGAASQPQQGA